MTCSRHKKLEIIIKKEVRNYFLPFLIQKTGSHLKMLSVSRFNIKNRKYFFTYCILKWQHSQLQYFECQMYKQIKGTVKQICVKQVCQQLSNMMVKMFPLQNIFISRSLEVGTVHREMFLHPRKLPLLAALWDRIPGQMGLGSDIAQPCLFLYNCMGMLQKHPSAF